MLHLVLGGSRSGKSSFAERKAKEISDRVVYVATATAEDAEMSERITLHKNQRPIHWELIEEPLFLSKIITELPQDPSVVLIDCMTLWLSNWICSENYSMFLEEKRAFLTSLMQSSHTIIIVSNEVGSGIVPLGELSREFTDQAGWLNQSLAVVADSVSLIVAGLPIQLKPSQLGTQ